MKCLLSAFVFSLAIVATAATADDKPKAVSMFDGKTFDGWEGDTEKTWKIEDGVIVGGSLETTVPRNELLWTDCVVSVRQLSPSNPPRFH